MSHVRFATHCRDLYRPTARAAARHAALSALGAWGALTGRQRAALREPRVQVLLLHHVFEHEADPFRRLLEALAREHELVTYPDAVDRIARGAIERPALAVTFDDGRANCRRAAAILEEFGARGCFFVCPEIVGVTDPARLETFCLERLHFPAERFMSWDDLADLADRGHEIGSHSHGHVDLGAVELDAAADDLRRARDALRDRLGAAQHFAWPYGAFSNMTAGAARTVYELGFESCASGVRGCHRAGDPRTGRACVRRDHVIAAWPARHVLALLARTARRPPLRAGTWPAGWAETIGSGAA